MPDIQKLASLYKTNVDNIMYCTFVIYDEEPEKTPLIITLKGVDCFVVGHTPEEVWKEARFGARRKSKPVETTFAELLAFNNDLESPVNHVYWVESKEIQEIPQIA